MNGQNIRPVQPFTMVSSLSLPQNCHVQPIGISNQELESLLAKPAKELPMQVFYELGNKLQPLNHGVRTGDWIHIAELLGFSRQQIDNLEIRASIQREPPGFLMLMQWRAQEDTSTLFILRDILWTCGRQDCVIILDRSVEEVMFMNLYLRILDEANQSLPMRLLKVRTKCDSTIRESIQNFLCGDSDDSEYELMDTPLLSKAKHFKGKQITLRKKNRTRPDILPKDIVACDTSSSDNSGEFNPPLRQSMQESKLLNQQVSSTCCAVDTEPEMTNVPKRCPDTTRKTIYISEDCLYCGRMRTVSRRRIVSETSFVKTGVHCASCSCSSQSPATGSAQNSSSKDESRFEHQCQNYDNCAFDISAHNRSIIEVDAEHRNSLNISTSRLSLEDPELTMFKSVHSEVTDSESVVDTGNPARRTMNQYIPDSGRRTQNAPYSARDVQYIPETGRNTQYLPMNQVKRQRSVSDPPETLLADLNNKFDLCISTSENSLNRPKRRKIELMYEEICEVMRNFPGWDPSESELTIEKSMFPLCKEDGHYVIWYMKKMHRVVVTVSHMGTLYHYAVFSERQADGQVWHYLFTSHKFTDIRSLLRYHMANGLDSQQADLRKEGDRHSGREQAKLSHVVLKYPRRPQPMARA